MKPVFLWFKYKDSPFLAHLRAIKCSICFFENTFFIICLANKFPPFKKIKMSLIKTINRSVVLPSAISFKYSL